MKSWIRSGTFVFFATGVVNVCNFAYHLVMVRVLRPEDYAALNALLALSMIVSVPAATIQATISRQVAYAHAQAQAQHIWRALAGTLMKIGIVSLGFLGVVLLGHRAVASFLQIPDSLIIVWWGVVVALLLVAPALIGALQGLQEFTQLGTNLMMGGVSRLVGGLGLVWLGYGVVGAVIGLALSAAVTCALAALQLRAVQRRHGANQERLDDKAPVELLAALGEWFNDVVVAVRPPWTVSGTTIVIAVAVTAYTSLTNSDVTLAKHYLPPAAAGDYAVAAMISRIILFLPAAVSIVLFPKVAHATAKGEDTRPLLRQMLGVTAGLSGVAAIVCVGWPAFITRVVTGAAHATSAQLVPWLAVAMVGLALANIVLTYVLAAGHLRHVAAFFVCAGLQVLGLWAWHATPWQIALVDTVIALLIAAYGLALAWWPDKITRASQRS